MNKLLNLIFDRIADQLNSFDVLSLKGFANSHLMEVSKKFDFVSSLAFNSKNQTDLQQVQNSYIENINFLDKSNSSKPLFIGYESLLELAANVNLDRFKKRILVIENNLIDNYLNQSSSNGLDFEDTIVKDLEIPEDDIFYKYYSDATIIDGQLFIQYADGIYDEFENIKKYQLIKPNDRIEPTKIVKVEKQIIGIPFGNSYKEYRNLKNRLIYEGLQELAKITIVGEEINLNQKEIVKEIDIILGFAKQTNTEIELFIIDERISKEFRPELVDLLLKHWKSSNFLPLNMYSDPDISFEIEQINQGSIVEMVIQQFERGMENKPIRDIFVTAPTGAGKSLLFQLPAIYIAERYNAVTIVISPLIALMKDQVFSLRNERDFENVAFLNSELSILERDEIIKKVHESKISVLYMSPELLLSYDLKMFIGDRLLGLLVIDEAHLVTTWGRDFRVDYWYVGNFIRKVRKYHGGKFPVMAVTATAVYGGINDMVFDTLDSLALNNAITFIGKVKRDNIDFSISTFKIQKSYNAEKEEITKNRIVELIQNNNKFIVYCPWTNQLNDIKKYLPRDEQKKIMIYHGSLEKEAKQESYEMFKTGKIIGMISTKAFGMGVDIADIKTVYHYAPSGHLADYVQEIGRVARDTKMRGVAKIDFNSKDLKFTKVLYGLSSIKQYQVHLVMQKLVKVFELKKKRNFMVSIEDFQYIFDFENVDLNQKVKSSLLLLEKDLIEKFNYNVIIARPKSLFKTVFARINYTEKDKFLHKYGEFVDNIPHALIESKGQLVFSLRLDEIWEKYFSKKSFPLTKKEFFSKELFQNDNIYVSPQNRLVISFVDEVNQSLIKFSNTFQLIESVLTEFVQNFFSKNDIVEKLSPILNDKPKAKRIAELIPEIYKEYLQERRVDYDFEYRVKKHGYRLVGSDMKDRFNRQFGKMVEPYRVQTFFLPFKDEKNAGLFRLSFALEAFELATYEITGGENPGIFIRINDPGKLKRISKSNYSNKILAEIDRRQKTSVKIMDFFFNSNMESNERWDFIERYFLGEPVDELIGDYTPIQTDDDDKE